MQIRVVGAHLPRLDQSGLAAYIARDVAQFRATLRSLRERGIGQATDEEIDQRAEELPGELDADLQRCALFELEVSDNDLEFDPSDIGNPDTGYLGWEPAFLSPTGEEVITESYKAPPDLRHFRVAFYVHEWELPGRLSGPTGELTLPEFTPVPARLWELAPYSCVD